MSQFLSIEIDKILFLDIETVPLYPTFDDVPDIEKDLWSKKALKMVEPGQEVKDTYKKAGIYSEFGKIICISVGIVSKTAGKNTLRLKSYWGHDEISLLKDFNEMVEKHFNTDRHYLCGHNGKEFDFPFIARRSLIHGLSIPACLDTRGMKPWEVRHLDTLELWRFGDFKSYSSLQTLTHIFGIPSPKDDIAGDQVCEVYWKEKNLERIVTYCQKDVVAMIQLFLKYRREELIDEKNIIIT